MKTDGYTGPVRVCADSQRPLGAWRMLRAASGSITSPQALDADCAGWIPAQVPGTVAAALGAHGVCHEGLDFDADDYWFACEFDAPGEAGDLRLRFEGLATISTVWLNGQVLLETDNMFRTHEVDVRDRLQGSNKLVLRFAALHAWSSQRRPRPRWKTRLVAQQNLRWARTTLLGRMPGWSPPIAPVGPFRPVSLVAPGPARVLEARTHATLDAGTSGTVTIDWTFEGKAPATARCGVGEAEAALEVEVRDDGTFRLHGQVVVASVEPWWPHTHGASPLYEVQVRCTGDGGGDGDGDGDAWVAEGGRVGFRALTVDRDSDGAGFGLVLNGEPIFCRGACWTTVELATLGADAHALGATLRRVVDAGMNMVRVGGTMTYESVAFFDLCDELGILVWHDFMFANMDYPTDDAPFMDSARAEAAQFLASVGHRPCLAVLCGGSEVYQQASMMGLGVDNWRSPLFEELLADLSATAAPDTVYVPNTPHGGALPFRLDRGLGHAYGVGAYLRPLEDAALRAPRFSPECLGFSNIPDDRALGELLARGEAPAHSSLYKQRVPRDQGAGWDFADVTDHYTEQLFGIETRSLRYADMERYLQLARVAPGEMMAAVTGLWRRPRSHCRGQLVWLLQDMWAGAGWGVLDERARPKASYYYLKRAFAPVCVWMVDEGLDGVSIEIANDRAAPTAGQLTVELFDLESKRLDVAECAVEVAAHGHATRDLDELLGRFVDTSYSYRFGPPRHHVIVATLRGAPDADLHQAFYSPQLAHEPRRGDLGLTGAMQAEQDGAYLLEVSTERFARAVEVSVRGYIADDSYFHMAPGSTRRVRLLPDGSAKTPAGRLTALNGTSSSRITVRQAAG